MKLFSSQQILFGETFGFLLFAPKGNLAACARRRFGVKSVETTAPRRITKKWDRDMKSLDIVERGGKVVAGAEDFDPALIFDCGQCFRWDVDENGRWHGIAKGRALEVERRGDEVEIGCTRDEFEEVWRDYFDMDRDYAALRARISVDPFTAAATEYGMGIRVLNQEFWETFCSFVISQCNNIARIKGIVSRLCAMYGEEIGEGMYAFPSAERIAALEPEDLAPLRSGYRAAYIVAAARAVAEGRISAEELRPLDTKAAIKRLCTVEGVGVKVASCTLLFGVGKPDAFPVDVWVRRALKEHYPEGFDGSVFGNDAGVAQQYIFHYIRHLGGKV